MGSQARSPGLSCPHQGDPGGSAKPAVLRVTSTFPGGGVGAGAQLVRGRHQLRPGETLFKPMDAVLCTEGSERSLVDVTLAPELRRGHGLADGHVDATVAHVLTHSGGDARVQRRRRRLFLVAAVHTAPPATLAGFAVRCQVAVRSSLDHHQQQHRAVRDCERCLWTFAELQSLGKKGLIVMCSSLLPLRPLW